MNEWTKYELIYGKLQKTKRAVTNIKRKIFDKFFTSKYIDG